MASMAELARLEQALSLLREQAQSIDSKGQRRAFAQLVLDERFISRSDNYQDYVDELAKDLTQLISLAQRINDAELIAFYQDRFVGKFAMLKQQLEHARAPASEQSKKQQWQKRIDWLVKFGDIEALTQAYNKQSYFEQQLQLQLDNYQQNKQAGSTAQQAYAQEQDILTLQQRLRECKNTTRILKQRINALQTIAKE